MWKTLRNGIRNAVAAALALLFLFGVFLQNACALRGLRGERAFYLYSASSQARIQSELQVQDAFFLTGESVLLAGYTQTDALELMQALGAELVHTERVGDTVCFYAFSPNLPRGVGLYGRMVNLHIAVSPRGCAVGTPIIFGGY